MLRLHMVLNILEYAWIRLNNARMSVNPYCLSDYFYLLYLELLLTNASLHFECFFSHIVLVHWIYAIMSMNDWFSVTSAKKVWCLLCKTILKVSYFIIILWITLEKGECFDFNHSLWCVCPTLYIFWLLSWVYHFSSLICYHCLFIWQCSKITSRWYCVMFRSLLHIHGYSERYIIVAYTESWHIQNLGIFRPWGIFKTLWNFTKAYSELCHNHNSLFRHYSAILRHT